MSWSRGSFLVALLALPASFAFADTVIVSDSCSLPNAVAYLNLPAADRDSPFNGCKRKEEKASDAHEIQLAAGTTHTVASEIPITTSLTIKGAAADETRPVIRVTSTASTGSSGRAFKIEVPVPGGLDKTSTLLQLAAASDGGVASDDYHTPVRRPVFENITTRVAGKAVYLCRYDAAATTPKWLMVGTSTVETGGSWKITPTNSLPLGKSKLNVADDVACVGVDEDQSITISVYDPLRVAFTGMNIEHADCASSCPADGGIFHTSELLSLDSVKLSGGKATGRGGAIFVEGEGDLVLETVELSGNSAPQGAAVYATDSLVTVQNSLVTDNTGNTIVAVGSVAGVSAVGIENSTFSGNTGLALSMHKGAVLNALTIVNNTLGGINFNSEDVKVHNSIVAGNGVDEPVVSQRDCRNLVYVPAASGPPVVTESPVFKFNLTGAGTGCTAAVSAAGSNSKELTGTLMAGLDTNGKCSGATQDGVLCPLADNGGVLKSHLPRLRAGDTLSRNAVNPVINQGYVAGLSGSDTALACPKTDQRDKSRTGSCDIGAVEVQLLSGTTFSGGQFESSGPSQSFSLREDLGDEELLPSARCAAEVSSVNGSPIASVPGCPWLRTQPTKGSVTFNADGTYTYTPFQRFHGFDEFVIQVTTTASILNDGTDPLVKSRSVRAQVFMDPESTVTSKSLLEGGALDWWYLTLGVLVLGRRVRWSK